MADDVNNPKRKKRHGLHGATIDTSPELQLQKNREYIVPVLCHALQIMEMLRTRDAGWKLEEIHQATGIPKSTAYRIVRTLVAKRYVARDRQALYKWSSFAG